MEKEFRIKSGDTARTIIGRFSATERAIFLALVAIAVISSLTLAYGASQLFMTTIPTTGGTLVEGEVGVPREANPILATSDADKDVTALVYAGLMKRDPAGDLVPDLAQSYTVSPDGLTYTFMMKSDARFDDGQPVTADDVVFTIQKTQDAAVKSPLRAEWADVSVEKTDDLKVQFTLKQPYAPFLGETTMGILPEHVWKSVSDDEFVFSPYNIRPVGDGPYRVSSVGKDAGGVPTSLSLAPNGGYPGTKPYLGGIVFRFYPDEGQAFDALQAGEIDSLSSLDPMDAAAIASSSRTRLLSAPLPREFGVFFNQNQNPLFADKAVRQALSQSIDRQAIVDAILLGYGEPIDSPVLALAGAGSSSPADIAIATSTLEHDGWKLGPDGVYAKTVNKSLTRLAFSIATADSPDLKQAANMAAAQWKEIGADVSVDVYEYGDLENIVSARSYDALLFGQYVSDGSDLYAFWDSSQRSAPGLNVAEYVSNKADSALEAARTDASAAAEAKDLSSFDAVFRSDAPAVMLYAPDFIYAVPQSLQGIDLSSVSAPADRWSGLESWYIDTERVWNAFANLDLPFSF